MRNFGWAGAGCLLAAAFAGAFFGQARADIRCDGRSYNTPYCQDQLVAEVAKSYGTRVSAYEIRENPNLRREICRFIGHDNRLTLACSNAQDHPGGGGAAAAGGSH